MRTDDGGLNEAIDHLLKDIRENHEADMERNAVGFCVVSCDLEYGSLYVTGPYHTKAEAQQSRDHQHAEVNRGLALGEKGWSHTVECIMPDKGDALRSWFVWYVIAWIQIAKRLIPKVLPWTK